MVHRKNAYPCSLIHRRVLRTTSDGTIVGMAITLHRTTFALDAATVKRLKKLALLWQVSQAEVVRRSIAQAEISAQNNRPDPVAMLQQLHAQGGGLDANTASAYLADVQRDRKNWRRS
jgi:predicted transcriptional regulator